MNSNNYSFLNGVNMNSTVKMHSKNKETTEQKPTGYSTGTKNSTLS